MIGCLARSELPAVSRERITIFLIMQACSLKLLIMQAFTSFLFCVSMVPHCVLVHKNAKRDPGQYPVTLTLGLVIESA